MREREDAEGQVLQPQHARAVDGRIRQAAIVLREDVDADRTAVDAAQHQRQIPEALGALGDPQASVQECSGIGMAVGQEQPRHERESERHRAHQPGQGLAHLEVESPDERSTGEDRDEHCKSGGGSRHVDRR